MNVITKDACLGIIRRHIKAQAMYRSLFSVFCDPVLFLLSQNLAVLVAALVLSLLLSFLFFSQARRARENIGPLDYYLVEDTVLDTKAKRAPDGVGNAQRRRIYAFSKNGRFAVLGSAHPDARAPVGEDAPALDTPVSFEAGARVHLLFYRGRMRFIFMQDYAVSEEDFTRVDDKYYAKA